jgi:hypothetical protein
MYRCGNEEWKIRNVFFSLLHTSNLDDTQNLKKHQVKYIVCFWNESMEFLFSLTHSKTRQHSEFTKESGKYKKQSFSGMKLWNICFI